MYVGRRFVPNIICEGENLFNCLAPLKQPVPYMHIYSLTTGKFANVNGWYGWDLELGDYDQVTQIILGFKPYNFCRFLRHNKREFFVIPSQTLLVASI